MKGYNIVSPLSIRLDAATLARIDALIPTVQTFQPRRIDALRMALLVGLETLERSPQMARAGVAALGEARHIADTLGPRTMAPAPAVPPLGSKPRKVAKPAPKKRGAK